MCTTHNTPPFSRTPSTSATRERARELRKNMTPAEYKLWQQLRRRQISDFRFRRQHPVGQFIADFACTSCHVIIEVDGDVHDGQREHDDMRTRYLADHGWHVIRFDNRQIMENLDSVLAVILDTCTQLAQS